MSPKPSVKIENIEDGDDVIRRLYSGWIRDNGHLSSLAFSGHALPLQAVRNTDMEDARSDGANWRGRKKSLCLDIIKLTEWLFQTGTVIATS